MRIRMQSNVPDAWVVGAIVLVGAAIVLAISALRLGAVDQRPASPLDAPSAAPAATFPATIAPTSPATNAPAPAGDTTSTTASPRVFTPGESPVPYGTSEPAPKTPYLIPPPGLPHN